MKNSISKDSKVTMALYPSGRGFGYVLFDSTIQPITYGTASVRPICNRRIMRRFRKFLAFYEPDLVLLHNHQGKYSRRSERVKRLLKRIQNEADKNGLEVFSYSREDIRNVFVQFDAKQSMRLPR